MSVKTLVPGVLRQKADARALRNFVLGRGKDEKKNRSRHIGCSGRSPPGYLPGKSKMSSE